MSAGLANDLRRIGRDIMETADALERDNYIDARAIKSQIERLSTALIDMVRLEPRRDPDLIAADPQRHYRYRVVEVLREKNDLKQDLKTDLGPLNHVGLEPGEWVIQVIPDGPSIVYLIGYIEEVPA